MKKIGSILILSTLLIHSVGKIVMYQLQQYCAKQEMKLVIANGKTRFQELTLTLAEYEKSKIEAHEIKLAGNMYDVKSIHISGNMVELIAVHDTEETHLLNKIIGFAHQNHQKNTSSSKEVQQLFPVFYFAPTQYVQLPNIVLSSNIVVPKLNKKAISKVIAIPNPPPEFV